MSLVSDVSASSSTMSSASSSSSTEVEYDNGVHTAAEMQAAWQAAGEAEMKKQAALHDELQRLTDENAKLTGQLEKMANEQIELKAAERVACMAQEIAQKEEAAKSEKLVANLQVRTEKQEEKIKQLSTAKHALEVRLSGQSGEFYNSLNAKVSSQTEEIKKLTDDNTLLKSRNENVEHDLREMQTRLNDVELGRQG